MLQTLLESRLLWEAVGSLLGIALIAYVTRLRKRGEVKAERAERLLAGFAATLDTRKDAAHALGDAAGALQLREITRAITAYATKMGLQNHLDAFLKARGLNQRDLLRHTAKPPGKPE